MPSVDRPRSRRLLWLLAPLSGVLLLATTLWPPEHALADVPPPADSEALGPPDEELDAPVPVAATHRLPPALGSSDLWLRRGATRLGKDQLRRALQDFKRAARLNPRSAEAWYEVALCSYELHRDRDAMAAARRALARNPSHPLSNLLAGFVQQQAGNTAAARRYYQRYLAVDPQGDFAGELKSVLTGLPQAAIGKPEHLESP